MTAENFIGLRALTNTKLLAAAYFFAFIGCTSSTLYDPYAGRYGATDRAIRVQGRFCTQGTDDVKRPIKLLFAMDTSQSLTTTDPDGTRATALLDLLDTLPDTPEIEIAVLLFSGDVLWLTKERGFQQLNSMSDLERQLMANQIRSFALTGGAITGANRQNTDFVKPLDEIYATISADVAESRLRAGTSGNPEISSYQVIFLSDGHPDGTNSEDADIFARCRSIRSLRTDASEVALNTAFVMLPRIPIPSSCPSEGPCQELMVQNDSRRLQNMAKLGGGEFRSFRNREPINFLFLGLSGIKRAYLLKNLLLFNLNALPNSPVLEPDSDSDGLTDQRELELGTDPTKIDSDGDGFSDGAEVYFRERGVNMDPVFNEEGSAINHGCPKERRGQDLDNDGLLDCDEEVAIGTSGSRFDSDGDGMPDLFEWLSHTHPGSEDAQDDPDRDGLINEVEMRMHTNPLIPEDNYLIDRAYRYQIKEMPISKADGKNCYSFSIDNVLLVPTLDADNGMGANEFILAISQTGGGISRSPPIFKIARFHARYPIGGIKDPPDGVIHLTPEDFRNP